MKKLILILILIIIIPFSYRPIIILSKAYVKNIESIYCDITGGVLFNYLLDDQYCSYNQEDINWAK